MGKSKTSAPEKVSPQQSAADVLSARQSSDPGAAALNYQIQSDPNYGVGAMSQLYQNVFNQLNPQYQGANTNLYQNLLTGLNSPYAITPEQQGAVDRIRGRSTDELQRALNTQANLGGGLYGGNNFNRVGQQVGYLQDQFANEDINLIRQQDAQNKHFLMQLMGMTPQPGVVANNYQSTVADPNVAYQGAINQNQYPAQQQAQQQASQNVLLGSLFQGLGTAAGGFFGGPAGAGVTSSLFKPQQQYSYQGPGSFGSYAMT